MRWVTFLRATETRGICETQVAWSATPAAFSAQPWHYCCVEGELHGAMLGSPVMAKDSGCVPDCGTPEGLNLGLETADGKNKRQVTLEKRVPLIYLPCRYFLSH